MSAASFMAMLTPELSLTEGAVYAYLVYRANGRRFCWPKVTTMASELRTTRATVMRATARLVELGLIRVERKRQRQANHYFILDPDGRLYGEGPVAPAPVERKARGAQLSGGITSRPHAEAAPAEVSELDLMPDRWWEPPAPSEVAQEAPREVAPAIPLVKDSRKEKRGTPSPAPSPVQKNNLPSPAHTSARAKVAHAVGVEDVKAILDRWKERAAGTSLPCPSALGPGLARAIAGGIRACGTAALLEAVDLVAASEFCRGESRGGSGWRASLSWVVLPANCEKVLAGNYSPKPKASWLERMFPDDPEEEGEKIAPILTGKYAQTFMLEAQP